MRKNGCKQLTLSSRGGLFGLIGALFLSVSPLSVAEEFFHARMDVADWLTDSSLLVCRMRQTIPFFGVAEFETWSGGELQFHLDSERPAGVQNGEVLISVEPPVWKPDHPRQVLGSAPLSAIAEPLSLSKDVASRLQAELYRGGRIHMQSDSWFSAENNSTDIGLSPVAFRAAYKKYNQCLSQLMPVPFDQLQRSKIFFESDKHELTDKAVAWIKTVARYVMRSGDVEQVFVDGHTDNTHTTTYNVELSRLRAEAVADRLQLLGLSKAQITLRFHGERYPIESNQTGAGKAANRRVTVRLQMSASADLPS